MSLLVAVRNEADNLRRCLESIERQNYPAELIEVVVADGQSTDGSRQAAEEIVARHAAWSVVDNPLRIQAAGWNLGIDQARGDVIGIVSAHAELDTAYITNAVETLRRTRADMVGGHFTPIGSGTVGEAVAAALSSPFGTGGAAFRLSTDEQEVDTVFMGLCRAETYRQFRFDARLVRNQDDEHSYRLRDAGGRIVMNPQIRSSYRNRSTIRSLASQYYQYGYWKLSVLRLHPKQVQLRHLAPPAFVAAVAVSLVVAPFSAWGRLGLGILTGSYLAADVTASIAIRRRLSGSALAVLPAVFPAQHLAYGIGMIVAAVRFRPDRSTVDPPHHRT